MLHPRQYKEASRLPQEMRRPVYASFNGKANAPTAIRAYCYLCKDGSENEIRNCGDIVCPLRNNRPFREEAKK